MRTMQVSCGPTKLSRNRDVEKSEKACGESGTRRSVHGERCKVSHEHAMTWVRWHGIGKGWNRMLVMGSLGTAEVLGMMPCLVRMLNSPSLVFGRYYAKSLWRYSYQFGVGSRRTNRCY